MRTHKGVASSFCSKSSYFRRNAAVECRLWAIDTEFELNCCNLVTSLQGDEPGGYGSGTSELILNVWSPEERGGDSVKAGLGVGG
jgi:hypothetical protein